MQISNIIIDKKKIFVILAAALVLFFAVASIYLMYICNLPRSFSKPVDFTVTEGMTGAEIGRILEEKQVIRSARAFRLVLSINYEGSHIKAGRMRVDPAEVETLSDVVDKLISGDALMREIMVTVPEGSRGVDIVSRLDEVFTDVQMQGVTKDMFDKEIGFLFPDSYAIDSETTALELIGRMKENYESHIAPLRDKIAASGMSEREVITLASILEREAKDEDSMRRVSGILQKRLAEGMRLQVDATLTFLLGKTSAELTENDLFMESPYNTYRNDGLPPGPINNPGLVAIEAVLNPMYSSDLFYLTAPDGIFYYAKTFEEHVANKKRYLR